MSSESATCSRSNVPDLTQGKTLLTVRSSPHSVWLELLQPIWSFVCGLLPGILLMGLYALRWVPRFTSWEREYKLFVVLVFSVFISYFGRRFPFRASYALHRRSSTSLLSLLLYYLGLSFIIIPGALQENAWLQMFSFVLLITAMGVLSFVVVETLVRCSRQCYLLTTDYLLISGWGMFGRSRKGVLICRIKRVTTRQSKWQRPFGIGDVIVTVEGKRRRRAIFMFDLVNYCEFGQAIQQAVEEDRFERR
jgi:membrane protein YdbS with pleckstrin-like domain